MRHGFAAGALVVCVATGCADRDGPVDVLVEVQVGSPVGKISPLIYGHFIEHLDGCIYGGVWDEEADELRTDTVAAALSLTPTVVRWPGGLFADGYHWDDGVGPMAERPLKENEYWGGLNLAPPESNHFGTNEFMAFVDAVGGASAYINVNHATGTAEEAARWVEYVNGSVESVEGARRAAHGHPSPYGVEMWGIGNETYGSWAFGYTDAANYGEYYLEFLEAMQAVDPSIKTVAVGFDDEWNETLLGVIGDRLDYLSIHQYYPGVLAGWVEDNEADFMAFASAPVSLENALSKQWAMVETALGEDTQVRFALDEWAPWWNLAQVGEGDFSVREAVMVAGVMNALHRLVGIVGMANYAQLVNVLGLINTSGPELYVTPAYHAMALYSKHGRGTALDVSTAGPVFSSDELGKIPAASSVAMVDASAVLDGDSLTVFVLNRSFSQTLSTRLQVPGFESTGEAIALGDDVSAYARNSFSSPSVVQPHDTSVDKGEATLLLDLAPHSLTVLFFTRST